MSDRTVVRNATKDVISELPGNVIERILECMPLQDAAKTSILSRTWRYNWASLPQLVFDAQFFKDVIINKPFKIEDIVNELLLLHIGPIHKFILCNTDNCSIQNRDVDLWILFLSRNGIRELTLVNLNQNNPLTLPSYLFSCQQLTHLKLQNYTFKPPPPAFTAFRYLRSLELKFITFATNIFESQFYSSPLLERFTLVHCNGVDHLNIHAPNLKYLLVIGQFKSISFISTPKLVEVFLVIMAKLLNHSAHKMANLDEFMGCLPRLEKLSMCSTTLKVLAAGGVPKRLATTANFLKCLKFYFIHFHDVDQISSLLCLLRSSINLQELEIRAFALPGAAIMEPVSNFMGKQDCADCTLNQLRKVKIQHVRGSKPELEFMEYLLACSPILDLMLIERHQDIDADAELRMSRQLMMFSRASPKAQIIYLDPPTKKPH